METITANRLFVTTCLAGMSLIAACSDPARPSPKSVVATAPAAESFDAVQTTSLSLNEQLAMAVSDLAQRLGIEEQDITVAAVRRVSWRSGALGCPAPGQSYTQALVPGILIILQVTNEPYGYHASLDSKPFHCPRERVERPASTTNEDLA